MTTPEEMRNDAERLRELASTMDRQAEEMGSVLSGVKSALKGDIWSGPAPERLEERIQSWIDDTESAAEQLGENARTCGTHAGRLDDDAEDQEKEEKDEYDPLTGEAQHLVEGDVVEAGAVSFEVVRIWDASDDDHDAADVRVTFDEARLDEPLPDSDDITVR